LAWTYEYIHQSQESKKETVDLKLDFAKAFDTIEHNVILTMHRQLGFPDKWISWVQIILNSGSSAVLFIRIGTHNPNQGWGVVLIDSITGPGPLQ
jgi:hypothetical protein